MNLDEQFISVGSIRLHVMLAGPEDGEPVLFLHGFPEFWWSWRYQMEATSNAGYRAIAPDLRGYNLSDKPRRVREYHVRNLRNDVKGLLDALGYSRAHIVGHDWGGALAWHFAAHYPEYTQSLTVMNCPHPDLFARLLLRSTRQLRRSWYVAFFQLPWLPERAVLLRGMMGRQLRAAASNKSVFTDDVVARYEEAMRQPGAATGSINYYRAILGGLAERLPRITVPTQVVWGADDPVLGQECNDRLSDVVDDVHLAYVPRAGHWVQQEAPSVVNEHLLTFVQANRA